MSCVFACCVYWNTTQFNALQLELTSIFHIVQVVSTLEVPTIEVSTSFQSKEVSGAQNSELLFCTKVSY